MKTITLTLDDQIYAQIEEEARRHGLPVEKEMQEIFRQRATRRRPIIADRDTLLSEAEAFHRDLGARGVCIEAGAINAAIKEARR